MNFLVIPALAFLLLATAGYSTATGSSAAGGASYPVHIEAINGHPGSALGDDVSSSTAQLMVVSVQSGRIIYSGQMPPTAVINLPVGRYSFYVQSVTIGFNATLANVDGPTTVPIRLVPYTMGSLIDIKTGATYSMPTDPSLIAAVVLGANQTNHLPAAYSGTTLSALHAGVSASGINSTNTQNSPAPLGGNPGACSAPPPGDSWVLYNTYDIGTQDQLQGAAYSWGKNYTDQVVNAPTPSQYSASYSYTSFNGGGLSEESATTYSKTSTETLATAQTYLSNGQIDTGHLNYDVYMQSTWSDYVYHMYHSGSWNGNVCDDMEMSAGGNFYKYDSSATSTSDYSFSHFYNLAVGDQQSQTVDLTLSTVGTTSQSFSLEVSFGVSSGNTGGSFSGTVDVAGYTSLNSQTTGTTVMYGLTGYGQCKGFSVDESGWVLGFGQGSPSC